MILRRNWRGIKDVLDSIDADHFQKRMELSIPVRKEERANLLF